MSTIQKELAEATGITIKRGQARQEYLRLLIIAITKMDDAGWNALSKEAQDWFNDAADEQNAAASAKPKREANLPDFPDMEEEKPVATGRRRAAAEPEQVAEVEAREPELDDEVTVTTKRGKVIEGRVVEIDDKILVVDNGTNEIECVREGATIVINGEVEEEQAGASSDEDPAGYEPELDDEVTVTNKRGKVTTGKVVEVTAEMLVVDDGKNEVEFAMNRVESVVPVVVKEEEKPAATGRRRAAAATTTTTAKEEAAKDAKGTRSSNPRGTSVGARIRELMAENLAITEVEVGKTLEKEGLEFRPPTLNMIFKDTTSFIAMLKAAKKLK